MTVEIKSPKKLIEVALPLDAINVASANEKAIRHGHPSTLHLWWARRPLAAARAVIFAQLVNDPASLWEFQNPGRKPSHQQRGGFTQRRNYLFKLITDLVQWENTTNAEVLAKARAEIRDSWKEICELNHAHPNAGTLFDPDKMPGLHDPFAGGGAIPLEAQRLGLEAFASDLNPVAVLINKAMIEIPPKFAGRSPVHPDARREGGLRKWGGAQGLAEDVRHYGSWMREEAIKRIGTLYAGKVVTRDLAEDRADLMPLVGQSLPVIAWLWARTVRSPNPAFSHVEVPLCASFILAKREGKEAWVEPIIDADRYTFVVRIGPAPETAANGTKLSRGASFRCILSGSPIDGTHIRNEATAGRMGFRLMAVVCEGRRGRVYLSPTAADEVLAKSARPSWQPDLEFAHNSRHMTPWAYGLSNFKSLFTPRQLLALSTFGDLMGRLREKVAADARDCGLDADGTALAVGGTQATAYADAVSVYLCFAFDKVADLSNSLVRWEPIAQCPRQLFGRQAIPMVWDFAEGNPLGSSSGSWEVCVEGIAKAFGNAFGDARRDAIGVAVQADASTQTLSESRFVCTDPPYYDNVPYADLSDFFYVWLRRNLRNTFPDLFSTIGVPKKEELVADPLRHGGKPESERYFLGGMTLAMHRLAELSHPSAPVTIYYAFKQSETGADQSTSSSGWDTFLSAVLGAGLSIAGTWPVRTENDSRLRGQASNALASSIVLVCRKREGDAPTISRREFIRELNAVLPLALDDMTKGAGDDQSPVAPVDLSQAIIGPGMAVFSKYAAVLEADGTPMTVKTALQLINRFLAEDDFDADTQFCLHWFEQRGWDEGPYGDADVLARAKATSVAGVDQAGVVVSGGGKVRLRRPIDYPSDWDPRKEKRLPVWEALHQLVRVFRTDGESGAGNVLAAVKAKSEAIRQLAYRLYTLCERRGWAEDARGYNDLVTAWPAIEAAANAVPVVDDQMSLFGGKK